MKIRTGCLMKRGNGWICQTVASEGKRVSQLMRKKDGTPCRTKEEAQKARVEFMRLFTATDKAESLAVIASRIEGVQAEIAQHEETANPPLTLAAAWEAYDRSPRRPDSGEETLRGYRDSVNRFKAWIDGKDNPEEKRPPRYPDLVALREVTPAIAGEFAQSLTGLSASTFNQRIGFLRLLWKTLADEIKGAGVNPWEGIARRKLQALANRKRPLTPAQFEAVISAATSEPDLKDLLIVLAWSGQRLVDALKLRWEAVDFRRHVITLYPQKTARRTGKAVHIPMFPAMLEVLNRRHAAMPHMTAAAYVFPALVEDHERDATALSKRIQLVFKNAGIETCEKRTGIKRKVVLYGAHSFRHLFVTAAASAGLPSAVIKSITGHSSDAMSEHYQQFDAKLAGQFAKQLTGKALPAGREPMPDWVKEGLARMTAKNWKTIRDELMKPAKLV